MKAFIMAIIMQLAGFYIGDYVYYKMNGRSILHPQKQTQDKNEQIKR